MMVYITDLSPSPALMRRLAYAFPGVDIENTEIGILLNKEDPDEFQRAVRAEIEQLVIETQGQ